MKACPNQPSWYSYFKENMDALGLPVPATWQGKGAAVIGMLSQLVAVSEKFGPRVTVHELLEAGTKGEVLLVAGGMSASWYLGGVIGSAAVATGRYGACGTRLIDVIGYAHHNRLWSPRVAHQLHTHPEIYSSGKANRRNYGLLARVA